MYFLKVRTPLKVKPKSTENRSFFFIVTHHFARSYEKSIVNYLEKEKIYLQYTMTEL